MPQPCHSRHAYSTAATDVARLRLDTPAHRDPDAGVGPREQRVREPVALGAEGQQRPGRKPAGAQLLPLGIDGDQWPVGLGHRRHAGDRDREVQPSRPAQGVRVPGVALARGQDSRGAHRRRHSHGRADVTQMARRLEEDRRRGHRQRALDVDVWAPRHGDHVRAGRGSHERRQPVGDVRGERLGQRRQLVTVAGGVEDVGTEPQRVLEGMEALDHRQARTAIGEQPEAVTPAERGQGVIAGNRQPSFIGHSRTRTVSRRRSRRSTGPCPA